MTRKQRSQAGRNITYDLSNPRNVAAFEALLEDDEADETVRSKPSKATRQQQAKKKREKEKFFQLKDNAAADDTSSPQQDPISHLMDMFEGVADKALVTDVYHASGSSLEAAAEALFALLGTDTAGERVQLPFVIHHGHVRVNTGLGTRHAINLGHEQQLKRVV